uniref:Grammistin Pp 1 n=4 Tax=Grammistini TaxID=274796 RepID=GRA1_POGPU|nr:RecName: Full=Grammistin Gs D [Grammistes sexlineatus]P69842.1 RecName: Full=Grammistin Pp 1 [Pogonoperca punctata]
FIGGIISFFKRLF